MTADRLDCFEDIGFTGPTVAILHPAKRVQLDVILLGHRFVFRIAAVEVGDEARLDETDRLGTAVQHDIEPDRLGRIVIGWND